MAAEIKNENGLIRISNAVIAKIAGYAATKCYGVVGMAMRTGKDGLARLLKKENLDKGIKIKVEDDKVDITLFVIMEYGVNIGTVGDIIKSNVKYQVEEATGLKVSSVTVNVESIRIH
ncbi:MAG: Asp23/Gls24 family envelope stress response protein [Eubacteriales bacterium]|nr:Asp23/Gls24 family envelope stress response protein [Eubacteriales bacterium]MDO5586518.1 Asp23/Gls24 family envelope stress response protein [Clostridia bacterium]MDY4212665.1 Asp23/Gls24 family envelope stress response protein [Eubacteriales bacterium]MDY5231193.1 Asp23/Gls24 family envelope stress response protein [Eubacteriales bacterium]